VRGLEYNNMNKFIFEIKRPIVIPVSDYANEGMIVYNTRDFALGYSILPNPREKVMTINLLIFRLSDEVVTRTIASFSITEQGFKTDVALNQLEIDAVVLRRFKINEKISEFQGLLFALLAEEASLAEQNLDTSDVSKQITITRDAINELTLQLNDEIVPQAEYLYINKYSDIIDYFDKDGSITLKGIEWAKTVPFRGGTLNDYLK